MSNKHKSIKYKMKSIKYIALSVLAVMGLASCGDSFLDHEPDERTHIDTEEKVTQLLVNAYPNCSPAGLLELSSDNIVDNNAHHYNADTKKQIYYNLNSFQRADDEAFKFEPVVSSTQQDSPAAIWSGYYGAIAVANSALQALDEIATKNGGTWTARMNAAKGEALLVRSFCHFMLVNIFSQAYKDSILSKQDVGVPYMTDVETEVNPHYDRGNVADTYKHIEADLEEGLKYVNDSYYTQPKWHFNVKAAHAYATRFYLFTRQYDKVIEHANQVLGTDRTTLPAQLPDYSIFADDQNMSNYDNHWAGSDQAYNLMLIDTYSYTILHFSGSSRYAHNFEASHCTIDRVWPTSRYTILPSAIVSGLFINGNQDYGMIWSRNASYTFQYADRQQGYGYYKQSRREFTTTEVLLNRAEAELLCSRHDTAAAFADIQALENSRHTTATYKDGWTDLTQAIVDRYYVYPGDLSADYDNQRSGQVLYPTWSFTQNMSPSFVIPANLEKWMNLIQDYRRTEMLFTGMRFFDLKRFGIEYSHKYGPDDIEYKLTWNDPRRAIEVPADAIAAGLQPSRETTSTSATEYSKSLIRKVD